MMERLVSIENVDKNSIDTHNDILTFKGTNDDTRSLVDVKNKKVYVVTEGVDKEKV